MTYPLRNFQIIGRCLETNDIMIMFALFVVVITVFFVQFSARKKRKQMKYIRTRFDDFPDYSKQIEENIRKSKEKNG